MLLLHFMMLHSKFSDQDESKGVFTRDERESQPRKLRTKVGLDAQKVLW
jgi:hypothetical protein